MTGKIEVTVKDRYSQQDAVWHNRVMLFSVDRHVTTTCIGLKRKQAISRMRHGACLVEELVQHEGDDNVRLHGQVLAAVQLREHLRAA